MAGFKSKDSKALMAFKKEVLEKYSPARFILFGSKARGRDNEFSDIDIAVILKGKVDTKVEREIFNIGFDVGLSFGVVFGIVVEDTKFWNSSLAKAMPFYQNVIKEGVVL